MSSAKILFLASNPRDTDRLALDREAREIELKLRTSEYRDSFELITKWSVRPDDLLQALNQHKPDIVQFSGHGDQKQEIILSDEAGHAQTVSKEALQSLFHTLRDNIKVVILNACYSRSQAEAIVSEVDCAIGMARDVEDDAAIVFVSSFFRALGFGRSVQDAFEQGKTAILLGGYSGRDIAPELLARRGVDPRSVFVLKQGSEYITELEFTVDRPLAEFDREKFKAALCRATGVMPKDVRIVSIRPGSTIIRIAGDPGSLAQIIDRLKQLRDVRSTLAKQGVVSITWEAGDEQRSLDVSPKKNPKIFISYSSKDANWLKRLKTMLAPHTVDRDMIWDDTRIRPGSAWKDEIMHALNRATVAVLLVSPDFLVSDFTAEYELPAIFKASEERGLRILWIAVRPALYAHTPLHRLQAVNDPAHPLSTLSRSDRELALVRICDSILSAVK